MKKETEYEVALVVGWVLMIVGIVPAGLAVMFVAGVFAAWRLYYKVRPRMVKAYRKVRWQYVKYGTEWEFQ